ncbi:molecular chaperone DnaJ [Streptacidiphilus pinicola]|uniref:Chaperone protein DnaJ n=1 Tax=Streptacidiphilus pinicola TaxID=2219663 RepID=A0A2X0J1Z8_9ACTN|nr:molecular chaperone DnaJ [Streptacidiphilus pinicola]RAG81408.1 molecular chaperone DnaJ [Streptacidiphilus pinicola]
MSGKDYVEKDYYKILGVPKDASTAEIKKAYRKLARENHPDANKGDKAAEERFKEISEANDVLSDPKRRKDYDEARALFANGGFRPGGAGGGFNFDLGDLFGGSAGQTSQGGGFGGGVGDLFGGLFGGRGRGTTTQPRRGADVESAVTLSFVEAVEGATVPIRMTSQAACKACAGTGAKAGTTPRVCPTCVGTGYVSRGQGNFALSEPCRDCKGRGLLVDDPCEVCHGSGRATSARTMQVRIPAGVGEDQRIRLKGKGAQGERGGPAGDLYVTVHVTPHPVFGRRGDNLTVTVPVSFPEAALGGTIKVPTLGGSPVTMKLPAGTSNGLTMRARGKGAVRKDGTRGDLLVTVEVAVPPKTEGEAKAALEKYRDATSAEDPRAALFKAAEEA